MKATDLMIGDWVKCTDPRCEGHQVDLLDNGNEEVGLDGEIDNFENIIPIPLTPEFLKKNGFKKDPEYIDTYWRPDCRKFCFVKENDDWYFAIRYDGGHICISECNYVHELQHALRLCGIDKELTLF